MVAVPVTKSYFAGVLPCTLVRAENVITGGGKATRNPVICTVATYAMAKPEDELRRLIISQKDLLQAEKFAEYIILRDLHAHPNDDSILVHKAFNTALIIAYARPFYAGRKQKTPVPDQLEGKVLRTLTRKQREFHDRILRIRREEQAHSDAEAHSVDFYRWEELGVTIPMSRNTSVPLSKDDVLALLSIIGKVKRWVWGRRRKLEEEVFG